MIPSHRSSRRSSRSPCPAGATLFLAALLAAANIARAAGEPRNLLGWAEGVFTIRPPEPKRSEAPVTAREIPADRLQALGKGETTPITDNNSAVGRAMNRRVEVKPR